MTEGRHADVGGAGEAPGPSGTGPVENGPGGRAPSAHARAEPVYTSWDSVQRAFFWLGVAQLALSAGYTVAFAVQGGSLEGPMSFRKAIVFSQAFGMVSLSFAFLLHDLGLEGRAAARWGFLMIWASGAEVAFASLQFWRGVPSHFNNRTWFDSAVSGVMAMGALAFAGFLGAVTVASWRADPAQAPPARRSLREAVRLSLPLAFLGLVGVGIVMFVNTGETWLGGTSMVRNISQFRLGRYNGQPPGLKGGGMLALHALGAHVLQVLPLAGWLAGRTPWTPRAQRRCLGAVAFFYGILMVLLAFQTFAVGAPLRELGPRTTAGIAGALLGLAASFAALLGAQLHGEGAPRAAGAALEPDD